MLASLGIIAATIWFAKNKILTWIFQSKNSNDLKFTKAPNNFDTTCILTSETGEGPFFFNSPFRKDIREGKDGKVLDLTLQILDYQNCEPIKDVIVEVWQCDATGVYSGYPDLKDNAWEFVKLIEFGKKIKGIEPSNEKQFLRGAQITNDKGIVNFTTIVPSWYTPRLPHIHVKVRTNERDYISTELHFEDDFCTKLFTSTKPYTKKGKSPYTHKNDKIITTFPSGKGLLLTTSEELLSNSLKTFAKIGIKTVS